MLELALVSNKKSVLIKLSAKAPLRIGHFTLHDYRPKSGHLDNIVPTYLLVYQLEGKS